MRVFIDTSAFYAGLCKSDRYHADAAATWRILLDGPFLPMTSNYIEVETMALVQARLGMTALGTLIRDLLAVVERKFIRPEDHGTSMAAVLAAGRRNLSFVDLSSFQFMKRHGIKYAFSFDNHFWEQGFSAATPKVLDPLR